MKKSAGVINVENTAYSVYEDVVPMGTNNSITLTEEQSKMFIKALKAGVYKQLHSKKLITDEQLLTLMKNNRKQ